MTSNIEPLGVVGQDTSGVRRSELEDQLNLAIKRAEKKYRQVLQAPQEKPTVNPPHLGLRIDIRI